MNTSKSDRHWMQRALELASRAEQEGEVPVGAVLVKDDEIIAEGWNCPIGSNDPTAHAEIITLRRAAENIGNYRLPGTMLYVTLEPCAMCAGAMVHARVQRLVYAAADPRTGAAGSVMNLVNHAQLNHQLEISGGIMEKESATLLQEFFRARRRTR